jgi:hypothetical protein
MVTTAGTLPRALGLSWAAKAQGELSEWDIIATRIAAERRTGARFWWGRRLAGTHSFAICYLCDWPIASWSGTTRIPRRAVSHVMEHRAAHWCNLNPFGPMTTAGTMPAAPDTGQEAEQ